MPFLASTLDNAAVNKKNKKKCKYNEKQPEFVNTYFAWTLR